MIKSIEKMIELLKTQPPEFIDELQAVLDASEISDKEFKRQWYEHWALLEARQSEEVQVDAGEINKFISFLEQSA